MEAHERPRLPRLPPLPPALTPDDGVAHTDLAEVEAAVALVLAGAALRVCLVGLHDAAGIAGQAAAVAQAAGLSFRRDPSGGSCSLIVGPRT